MAAASSMVQLPARSTSLKQRTQPGGLRSQDEAGWDMAADPQTPNSVSACVRRGFGDSIASYQKQVFTLLTALSLTYLVRRLQLRVPVALAVPWGVGL